MLCDICKKNEATVHITKITNGMQQEFNICEKCAKEKGEFNFPGQLDFSSPFTFQNILTGIMDYISSPNESQYNFDCSCKNCGISFSDFKKRGLVGCSHCYSDFTSALIPVIKRVQGNLEHTGKIPKRAGKNIIGKKKLLKLKESLKEAISTEEYEKAAQIRDKIKELEKTREQEG